MEPITTTVAINAVVLYLAKKLADNKGISGFFNDFTDASVAWIKPIFLTEEGKEKEVIADLTADPNEQLNKDAVATAIAKAVKKNPDAEQLLQEMAKVIQQKEPSLGTQNTITRMQMGNLDDIRNGALTTNIEFVVYYVAGVAQYNQANYLKSIVHFSKTISLKPDDVSGYFSRGNAYYSQQEYAQAIIDYNKAIELDPKYAAAYNNRGLAYANQQEYAQAIADYNKAIELDPNDADAYNNRGLAYRNQQEYDQAIADYNKALSLLDPNDPFVEKVKQVLHVAKTQQKR